jgi:gamma-glutamyltranspeptidase/glutathione hydrolase
MAIDAPRWRVIEGVDIACEDTMPEAKIDALKSLGHVVSLEAPDNAFGFGGAQLICKLDDQGYAAGSDPRKDGLAAGF